MARKKHYYLCNIKKKKEHCKLVCLCGRMPHHSNECTKNEFCGITKQIVQCVKLNEKELNKWRKIGWKEES